MKVDIYEKVWMWGVTAMLVLFFATTAWAAYHGAIMPPSHVETIDPAKAMGDARFRPMGVYVAPDGSVNAHIVGMTFAWLPGAMTVPAGTPVTFHITSIDVVHGFEIVRTNGQSMVIPGYISQFTTQFNEPGEYLIACNEYCGQGHATMAAKFMVVPRAQWQPPAAPAAPAAPPTSSAPAGGDHVGH
jgi:cytochrome c oxidase subunit II